MSAETMSDTLDEANQKLKIATEQWELCIELAKKLERERDEAREIIRKAKAKFCEEGSDGNIASEMFSILSGGK